MIRDSDFPFHTQLVDHNSSCGQTPSAVCCIPLVECRKDVSQHLTSLNVFGAIMPGAITVPRQSSLYLPSWACHPVVFCSLCLCSRFSDPQGGKGPADHMSAASKNHIRRSINEGHDVTTAEQMKDAILSHGGVKGGRCFYSANARKKGKSSVSTSSTTLSVEMRVCLPEEPIGSVQAASVITISGGHQDLLISRPKMLQLHVQTRDLLSSEAFRVSLTGQTA